jgi:hypothetical protein
MYFLSKAMENHQGNDLWLCWINSDQRKRISYKKIFFVVQIQFQKVEQNPYYNYRPLTDFIRMVLELHYIRIHILKRIWDRGPVWVLRTHEKKNQT